MSYPLQFISMYINPSGNIAASGYFNSHYTQILANMYPEWHGIRLNRNSIGQQWLSSNAMVLDKLNRENMEDLDNKFINLAHVDEVDVLYRMKIPSAISLLGGGSVTCYTAPSGITPVGYPFTSGTGTPYNNIRVEERFDIEDFYYGVLPTRMTADFEIVYNTALQEDEGFQFYAVPSGILDPFNKYVTPDKRVHDVTWCHDIVRYSDRPYTGVNTSGVGWYYAGGRYVARKTGSLSSIRALVRGWGSGQATMRVWNISGANPSSVAISQESDILPTSPTWIIFNFSSPFSVTAGTRYLISISCSGGGQVGIYYDDYPGENTYSVNSGGIPPYPLTLISSGKQSLVYAEGYFENLYSSNGIFRKQDKESMGDYGVYMSSASGTPMGMTIYRDMVWWVGHNPPSGYCINLDSIKTREGQTYLDRMATYDITNQLTNGFVPSGIAIDSQGYVWLSDDNIYKLCKVTPRYDYFLVDKDNRYIYFKEDYSNPGVFVRPN